MYNLYFYYYNLGVPDVNFYFQKNHFLDVFFKYFFTIQVLRVWSYNRLLAYTYLTFLIVKVLYKYNRYKPYVVFSPMNIKYLPSSNNLTKNILQYHVLVPFITHNNAHMISFLCFYFYF